jgi:hypothetical protein
VIRTFRRPANSADLAALRPAGTSLGRNVLQGSLPVAGFAFLVALLVSRSALIAGAIGGGLFALSLASNARFFGGVKRRAAQRADADAVEIIDVEAVRVLDLEPLGSHGPALVVFSDDGQAVMVIGQWLLEQPSFPSLAFRLARWADTGKPIRVESTGPAVTPEHSTIRVPNGAGDVEIFQATPDTLAEDLERRFGRAGGANRR